MKLGQGLSDGEAEELIDWTESNESDKAHEAVPSSITNFLGNLLKN